MPDDFPPPLSTAFSLYLYFQTIRDGSEQLIWDHFVQAQGVEDGFQINSLRGFNWAVAVSEAVLRIPGLVPDEVKIKRADGQVRRRVSMNWRELERKREIRLLPACRRLTNWSWIAIEAGLPSTGDVETEFGHTLLISQRLAEVP